MLFLVMKNIIVVVVECEDMRLFYYLCYIFLFRIYVEICLIIGFYDFLFGFVLFFYII